MQDFNGKIVPSLLNRLGKDAIERVTTASLSKLIRIHHNYLPYANMEKGHIKEDWPDDMIFVDEQN